MKNVKLGWPAALAVLFAFGLCGADVTGGGGCGMLGQTPPANLNCNPGYPQGMTGTLRVEVNATFRYTPEGDAQIEGQKMINAIEQDISNLAAANPNGPQIEFVTQWPCDMVVEFFMNERGNYTGGPATAYWGNVDTMPKGSGYLFRYSTQAYEPDAGDWPNTVIDEAAKTWYGYIANGWTCN